MSMLRIKELMIKKNISRKELSTAIGISETAISNICNENNYPKMESLPKFAEIFDVDIRELFNPTKGGVISKDELLEAKKMFQNGLKMLDGI